MTSKKEPTPGVFEPKSDLMWQLEKLKTEELATKWWKEYLAFHNGDNQGIKYLFGYFADEQHRNNLYKWLK